MAAELFEYGKHRIKVFRTAFFQYYLTLCASRAGKIGRCGDTVGHNGKFAGVKFFFAADNDSAAACADYVRSAEVEEVGKTGNFGFARRVVYLRPALGEDSREDNILRCADRGERQRKLRTFELFLTSADYFTVLFGDGHAHFPQGVDMYIYRTLTEVAAAGECYFTAARSSDKCAEEKYRRAHFAHKSVGDIG